MIVDASALVAILLDEPEAEEFIARLHAAGTRATHPISIYEATAALLRERARDVGAARAVVSKLLADAEVDVVSIGHEESRAALDAFARYGKGRGHPAQLNMGDCFSYACAEVRGWPLLYKGDDFSRTGLA